MMTPDGEYMPHTELALLRALSRGETVRNAEFIVDIPEGRFNYVAHARPIYGESGEVIQAVSIFDDVTPAKQIEAALQSAREQERTLTEALWTSLLPEEQESYDGCAITAANRRAASTNAPSVAFCDVYTPTDGVVALVVGALNQPGNSLQNSISATQVKAAVRGAITQNPDGVPRLQELGQAITSTVLENCSICCCILNVFEKSLRYASIGDLQPMCYVRWRKEVMEMSEPQGRIQLQPGDRLLLLSTAQVEIAKSQLASASSEQPSELAQQILASFGDNLSQDLAALLLTVE